jgi:hypothetical protein
LLFASSLPFYTVRVNVGAVVLLLLLLSLSLSSLSSLSSSLICITIEPACRYKSYCTYTVRVQEVQVLFAAHVQLVLVNRISDTGTNCIPLCTLVLVPGNGRSSGKSFTESVKKD